MKREYRWAIGLLLLGSLPLAGCSKGVGAPAEAQAEAGPVTVEHMDGVEPAKLTLTEDAVKRIDVQTTVVREVTIGGATARVIPYAAVLYDTAGDTWTYLSPQPGVYVRHRIVVRRVEGQMAVLEDGPPAGTAVVIVGAAELYGSETEFEEE
jgi:hypothetical protein